MHIKETNLLQDHLEYKSFLARCRHEWKHPVVGVNGFERLTSNNMEEVMHHVANIGPLGVVIGGTELKV